MPRRDFILGHRYGGVYHSMSMIRAYTSTLGAGRGVSLPQRVDDARLSKYTGNSKSHQKSNNQKHYSNRVTVRGHTFLLQIIT